MSQSINSYLPIALMFIAAVGFAGINAILSGLFGPYRPTAAKNTPYECGAEPVGEAQVPFANRYYRVAMLFLLFDVEVALMFPFLAVYNEYPHPWVAFCELTLFMALLLVGYLYVRGRGGLQWD